MFSFEMGKYSIYFLLQVFAFRRYEIEKGRRHPLKKRKRHRKGEVASSYKFLRSLPPLYLSCSFLSLTSPARRAFAVESVLLHAASTTMTTILMNYAVECRISCNPPLLK